MMERWLLHWRDERGREIIAAERERLDRPGDIAASYSADVLSEGKGIRAPFAFRGEQWIAIGLSSGGGADPTAECYRVVVPRAFRGQLRRKGEDRLSHPLGPYHGDRTKHRGKDVMLQGPPVIFATERAISALPPPAPADPIAAPDYARSSTIAGADDGCRQASPEPTMPESSMPPAGSGSADIAGSGSLEAAGLGRRCVECLGPVDTSRDPRKMFCSDAHRTAFHSRQLGRGRKLVPLMIAERIVRGGDRRYRRAATGIAARKRGRALIAQWVAEDKAASRMAMDEYVELRMRLGFTD